MFIIGKLGEVKGIIAYDCAHENTNISSLSLIDVGDCDFEDQAVEEEEITIQLLQIKEIKSIQVKSCLISVTRLITRCAKLYDAQVVKGGLSNYIEEISAEQCQRIHDTGIFMYRDKIIDGIKSNSSTDVELVVAGWTDKKAYCGGGYYYSRGEEWHDVVVQLAMRITILDYQATLRLNEGELVLRSGLRCNYFNGGCMDTLNGNTYWKIIPESGCQPNSYDVLYQGKATMSKQIDKKYSTYTEIISVTTGETIFSLAILKEVPICMYTGYQTEHPKLIVIKLLQGGFYFKKQPVEVKNLDLFTYINSKFVYTERHIRKQITALHKDIMLQKCELERQLLYSQLSIARIAPIEFAYMREKQPGYTALTEGEVIYMFKCQPVEVAVRKTTKCFDEIPVTYNNEDYYMIPRSHLLQQRATEVICSSIISPKYKLNERWFSQTPSIIETTSPEILQPNTDSKWRYEDPGFLAKAGIYSHERLEALRHQIMFPSERQAISSIIISGSTNKKIDHQGIKLTNLLDAEEVDKMLTSYWTKAWSYFIKMGTISSGIIGILITIKVIKFIFDTVIHAIDLYPLYGRSWKLIGACWDAMTQCLINRHHRQEFKVHVTPSETSMVKSNEKQQSTEAEKKDQVILIELDKDKLYPTITSNESNNLE